MSQQESSGVVRIQSPGLIPPSVNHYKVPVIARTRNGPKKTFMVTPEGKAYKAAVAIFARGQSIAPGTDAERLKVRYALYVKVFLGKGQKGDGDNFWKCIADGLTEAGVIHSDARVRRWRLDVEDTDRENPRTEIWAKVIPGTLTRGPRK